MKKLIFILLTLVATQANSQTIDSTTVVVDSAKVTQLSEEIKTLRCEGIILLSLGAFSHLLSGAAFIDNDFFDSKNYGLFIVETVNGVALDIVGIIYLCKARKKKKELMLFYK